MSKKKEVAQKTKSKKEEKQNIFERISEFFHGVKVEAKRVHWTEKKDLVKYSITTFVFVVFFGLYFYLIDAIFALVHSLI